MKKLLLLLCLVPMGAWAETLYVRPIAAEYGAENGSSYAAAFDGFADVSWGVGAGAVSTGDTLVVCGSFVAADVDASFRMIDVDVSGSIIDGDCSGNETNAASWVDKFGTAHTGALLNGGNSLVNGVFCLDATDCPDLTVKNLALKNFTQRAIYIRNALTRGNAAGTIITDVLVEDTIGVEGDTPTSILGYGTGVTITRPVLMRATDDLIHWEGSTVTINDGTMVYPGYNATTNIGDCIQFANDYTNVTFSGNSCDHRNQSTKQCFILSGGSSESSTVIKENTCLFPLGDELGNQTKPIYIDNSTSGLIDRNYILGGWAGIWCASDVDVRGNIVDSAVSAGIYCQGFTGTQTVANNTIQSTAGTDACLKVDGAGITMTVVNNAVNGNCDVAFDSSNAAARTWQYNNAFGYTDLDTGFTTDGTNLLTNPAFVGGTAPTTVAGFRTACGSPLIATGTPLGPMQDYGNRRFGIPPSIGAWEHASGDAACTVTARSTVTPRTTVTARSTVTAR